MTPRRNLRLLWLGVQAELRSPGFRLLGSVAAVMSGVFAWNQGNLAASTGVILSSWLARGFGISAALWFAYAAVRDQNDRLGAVIRSKPIDGAQWVGISWLTGIVVWELLLALSCLTAALAQFPAAGIRSFLAFGLGFVRASTVLVAIGTLSYAFSRITRNPIGGILVAFSWFCAMAGLDLVPPYLRPDYSQNSFLFLGAAAVVIFICAFLLERHRRGELRRPVPAVAGTMVLVLIAAGASLATYRATPEARINDFPIWLMIEQQDIQEGNRVPGFWLPDGKGGRVSTAAAAGKILLIYLFPGPDPEAARTLLALDEVAGEFADQGVQPIGICLSQDQGHGPGLSWTGGYRFPIAYDPTTVSVAPQATSSVAVAYRADTLPVLVVTDRQRRVREILRMASYSTADLRRLVQDRLK